MMRMQDSNKHKQDTASVKTSDSPKPTNDTAGTTPEVTPSKTTTDEQSTSALATTAATADTSEKTDSDSTSTATTDTTTSAKTDTPEDTTKTDTPTHTAADTTTAAPVVVDSGVTEGSNRPLLAFIAGIIVAVLGWYAYTNLTAPAAGETTTDYADPIAVVNGAPVNQDLFVQNLNETLTSLEAQGLDIEDQSIRESYEVQVLDTLINTRLLVAAAEEAGYAPTEEEIQTRISELEAQFGDAEALDSQLSELGLDRDSLYTDVAEQLSVDTLLAEDVLGDNLTVTDAELQEAYDVLIEAGRELPELDTIRDALTAQIEQQKQQQLIGTYLDELRDAAEIEINL